MEYLDHPQGCFVDRLKEKADTEPVDVIMATLDAESFLEKCLYTVYREIPVRKLVVCDGGSKDDTLQILKNYPRVELFVKPEIRTTGRVLEFLISMVETSWFVMIDSDIELTKGWYDEMKKHVNEYDALESGKRINAFHFYREEKSKLESDTRSLDICHLVKKSAVQNFHCDDDYMWRYTDIFLRQVIEESGFTYGKVNAITHVHNQTEKTLYKSDTEKNYQEIRFIEPQSVITDQKKYDAFLTKHAKAVVKYLDPDYFMVKNVIWFDPLIALLDRDWIEQNGPKWLKRYDAAISGISTFKRFILRILVRSKLLRRFKYYYQHKKSPTRVKSD